MKIEVFNENGQLIDRLSQLAVEFRGYTPVDIAAKSYEIFDLYKILAYGESDIFFTSIAGQDSLKHMKARTLKIGTYIVNVFLFADNLNQKEFFKFKVIRKGGLTDDDVEIKFIGTQKKEDN